MNDLDIRKVRQTIVKGLGEFTKSVVALRNITARKPGYPYISYSIISYMMDGGTSGNESFSDSESGGLVENVDRQVEMVISVTVIGDDPTDVAKLAMSAYEYFELAGRQELKDQGITVVKVAGGLEDRTTFSEVEYETRMGFDVRIRVAATMTRDNVDYIDAITMKITDTTEILEVQRTHEV